MLLRILVTTCAALRALRHPLAGREAQLARYSQMTITDLHASAQAIVTHWRELRQLHPTWGQRVAPATLH